MSRKAEISGQSTEFGWPLDPSLNVNPFDGIAFFNVVNIFEEVQVQVEAIRSFHRVGQLLPRDTTLTCLGLEAVGCKEKIGQSMHFILLQQMKIKMDSKTVIARLNLHVE